jgi:hypothetical protein
MIRWARRIVALDPVERRLVLEAALLLLVARLGVRLWRLPTLQRVLAQVPLPIAHRQTTVPLERLAWAVAAAARRVGPTTCLMDASAAYAMLTRRGYRAALRLGVRRDAERPGQLASHAWVECDGRVIVGDTEGLGEYAVLASAEPEP